MSDKTNLILNSDGSIYHLGLLPGEVAETIFLVGDPERVPSVSKHFSNIYVQKQRREICTHTGVFRGQKVTCISTGMGTDNVDIVLNELDALFNVNLQTGLPKERKTTLQIIRLGTSGSLQDHIPTGSILASAIGIGLDALGIYYQHPTLAIADKLFEHLNQSRIPVLPYAVESSFDLLQKTPVNWIKGITATCPGFYAPQGRLLRAADTYPRRQIISALRNFIYEEQHITNIEMETAGIYLLSQALGHKALSLNAILANRVNGAFAQSPQKVVEQLIEEALHIFIP